MKQVTSIRLRKPIQEPEWELTEPEWMGDSSLSFYIPIWFNPDEYIERINVNSAYTGGYINLYLNYCTITNTMELSMIHYDLLDKDEFDIAIEVDPVSRQRFMNIMLRDWGWLLQEENTEGSYYGA